MLTLAGRVPIALGSLLNLILWDFQKLYPGAFKAISRAGITWVPRHQSKGTYELSPDDADLTEYSDDQTMLERKLQFTAVCAFPLFFFFLCGAFAHFPIAHRSESKPPNIWWCTPAPVSVPPQKSRYV